jgi:hypothetical protein
LKSVRGRYLFFIDQDDYLADDTLESVVRVADENKTDVVLARIKGLGGRNTPRTMFARTLPRTDVFSSPAYLSLNPLKLFRSETVRRLGLSFDETVPWGEDQPFVANAYLKGNGISILADKDYVFWRYREDLSNITTSVVSLEDRMPVVQRMFDFVADLVPPGKGRDRLMERHFRVELADSAFEGYRSETDPALRARAFELFRRVVDMYYNRRIASGLAPEDRVAIQLVSEGRFEEFGEYLDITAGSIEAPVCVEGDHVFLELPWFRDAGKGLPDDLFDIGPGLRAGCRVETLSVDRDAVHVSATCRLGALSDRITGVSLIARSRAGDTSVDTRLAYEVRTGEGWPFVVADDAVPSADLFGTTPPGKYDLYLRVTAGDVWRETRFTECAPPPAELRTVRHVGPGGSAVTAAFNTTANGALSLRVMTGTPSAFVVGLLCGLDRFADVVAEFARRAVRRLRRLLRRS